MKTHIRYLATYIKEILSQMSLRTCNLLSCNLGGLEEGITYPMMLPLQISNNNRIELLQYGLQFHYVCGSKI